MAFYLITSNQAILFSRCKFASGTIKVSPKAPLKALAPQTVPKESPKVFHVIYGMNLFKKQAKKHNHYIFARKTNKLNRNVYR
jgi:hypothetical protein